MLFIININTIYNAQFSVYLPIPFHVKRYIYDVMRDLGLKRVRLLLNLLGVWETYSTLKIYNNSSVKKNIKRIIIYRQYFV